MRKKSINISIILILISLSFNAIAQVQIKSTFEGKHHMLSPDELDKTKDPSKDFYPTAPATGPVRNIAEPSKWKLWRCRRKRPKTGHE